MATKHKTTTTKKTVAKPILFLHVRAANKKWFQHTVRVIATKTKTRVTDSAIADKILAKLRTNKKLLNAVLK